MTMLISFNHVLALGLIYGLVALGVYFTFRLMRFPDLSVDGTFPLGAAVSAVLLIHGVHPLLTMIGAFFAGLIAGYVTGILNIYLRIMGLLAGILTMTALYSVNLRIMGQPNIALLDVPTLFSNETSGLWLLAGMVLFISFACYFFMVSEQGLALRASGMNPQMSQSYGICTRHMTLLALALSNGLVALSGALFAEMQGFADVSLGTGTIVIGLASIMIGEAIVGSRTIKLDLLGCILGAIIYRLAIALALNSQFLGLQASDLNFITAIIVILALGLPKLRKLTS